MAAGIELERLSSYIKDLGEEDARKILINFRGEDLCYEIERREVEKTAKLNALKQIIEGK